MGNKVANVAHKVVVTGLMSVFAWQAYQIGTKCTDYVRAKKKNQEHWKNDHAVVMEVLAKKVDEESGRHEVGTIPDRYDADDNSYLDKVPNLTEAINNRGR